MRNKGLVYVFVGDGKGKTSAALGVALRMLLTGKDVVWISWYKTLSWKISEAGLVDRFKTNFKMFFAGEGFFIKGGAKIGGNTGVIRRARVNKGIVYDTATEDKHKIAAEKALFLAREMLMGPKRIDLMVMDEVIKAVDDGLLSEIEVIKLIEQRGETHLVLTGHVGTTKIMECADLVTEMKKIKHPYDKGIMAVKGLDY